MQLRAIPTNLALAKAVIKYKKYVLQTHSDGQTEQLRRVNYKLMLILCSFHSPILNCLNIRFS